MSNVPRKNKVAIRKPIANRVPQVPAGVIERFEKAIEIRNKREGDDADLEFLLEYMIDYYTENVIEAENDKAEKAKKQPKGDDKPQLQAVAQSA